MCSFIYINVALNDRLIKHLEQPVADIKGPEPSQEVKPAQEISEKIKIKYNIDKNKTLIIQLKGSPHPWHPSCFIHIQSIHKYNYMQCNYPSNHALHPSMASHPLCSSQKLTISDSFYLEHY